jgi:hypothetical protein
MAARPRFLLPLVISLIAQTLFAVVIFQAGIVMNDALAKMEIQGKSPEVIAATEKFFDSPAAPVIGGISTFVVVSFVLIAFTALMFFMGNLMLGARLTFKHYFCVATHTAVLGLVDLAVRAVLAVSKGTMDVRLGLGNLFGDDIGFLGRFVDTISNPLLLWPTAVSALGISIFAKKGFGFGVLVVLPGFLLGALLAGMH